MSDPQSEVRVWLHGSGTPRDVTENHVVACATPFTIGIGSDGEWSPEIEVKEGGLLILKFCERRGDRRLLGEIGLQHSSTVRTGGLELWLFQVRSCRNYCLPKVRLWAHYLHQAYLQRGAHKNPDVPISAAEARSMGVFFICPRPVVLVSVAHGDAGNIFPMNLMGPVGKGYFAFALNSARQAAPLVEHAGRVALSSVPFEQSALARQLAKNHRREFLHWNQFPFATRMSASFHIPVPCFALRVREMEIETVRNLGSHTLFVARMIQDERYVEGPQFFMVHGIYQAWRLRETKAYSQTA